VRAQPLVFTTIERMPRVMFYRAILVFLFMCLPACAQSVSNTSEDDEALSAATQGLCRTQVAMLGESATHGDGHTLAFKVALVERLVDQCEFDSVFFEANHDEFIHLNKRIRSGQAVTSEDLLSAVGGLWKFYREFQPLAPFLLTRAQAGRVFLGGIDDQLGQLGQNYANVEMVAELTDLLPQPERQRCSTALHKRVYYDYSDAAPYSKVDRSQIVTCLSEIQVATAADKTTRGADREERLEMISATQRWVDRDFSSSDAENIVNRDRSMFQNSEWLQSRLPKRHKVIVWAATVHIAKQGDPTWGDRIGTNFGSFVHRKYGNQAYSLGFSALTGSYRQGKGNFLVMPSAPPNSVEIHALQDGSASASYVGPSQLTAMGAISGAFFRHSYQTFPWSEFLDGVVVFRAEHPPSDMRDK
jgi:erythromycin esterase-like protein